MRGTPRRLVASKVVSVNVSLVRKRKLPPATSFLQSCCGSDTVCMVSVHSRIPGAWRLARSVDNTAVYGGIHGGSSRRMQLLSASGAHEFPVSPRLESGGEKIAVDRGSLAFSTETVRTTGGQSHPAHAFLADLLTSSVGSCYLRRGSSGLVRCRGRPAGRAFRLRIMTSSI